MLGSRSTWAGEQDAAAVGRVEHSGPHGEGFSFAHMADSWRDMERLTLFREKTLEEFLFEQSSLLCSPPVSVMSTCFFSGIYYFIYCLFIEV